MCASRAKTLALVCLNEQRGVSQRPAKRHERGGTGNVRHVNHGLNIFVQLPTFILKPFDSILNGPLERVDAQPPHGTDSTFLSRFSIVFLLLALANVFDGTGDSLGKRNLKSFVGGNLLALLLLFVLLFEACEGGERTSSASTVRQHHEEKGQRQLTWACTFPTFSSPCAPWAKRDHASQRASREA